MAESSVLIKQLYPIVERGLSKKDSRIKLRKGIHGFLDRNTERLTTVGPIHRVLFLEDDMNVIYNVVELDAPTIKQSISTSPYIKSQWENMSNPFNTAIVLAIRYYMLKNDDEMVHMLLIYFGMSMYPSLYTKYFKHGVKEQVMNYTVNNLSNKYKVKQTGTFYNAMNETSMVCFNTNKSNLKRGTDRDLVLFVNDEKTRLSSLMKKIANEYYDNDKEKKYFNLDSDSYEEDNYHEADNNTFAIDRLTNSVVLKLVVNGPDMKLVNIAANMCQVSVNELRNYTNTMINNERREEIKEIVESILFLYIFDGHHTIQQVGSNKFLSYCLDTYKKSNTTDTNIIKIKKILDSWLDDLGTYKKTQRLATINNFRRALFIFFVFTIQRTF